MKSIKDKLDVVRHSKAAGKCYTILSKDQSHMVMIAMSNISDIMNRRKWMIKNAVRVEIYGGE